MWLSQQRRDLTRRENTAETGKVTLGGDPAGVYLSGERRSVRVYSPGGYQWSPTPGQDILVLKTGADGESPCAVGIRQEAEISPGEVRISNADGSVQVFLKQDGTLALRGVVTVNGTDLEELIKNIAQDVLSERESTGGTLV